MSIIRENLMTREGYSPYCGSTGFDGEFSCRAGMPRTKFNGSQFECVCGWKSAFDPDFIDAYKAKWHTASSQGEKS